jgi:hypothetical protein
MALGRTQAGSEDEVRGLNAVGNPAIKARTGGDAMDEDRGPVGNILPTGILARGTADKTLWSSRGGAARGSERLRPLRGKR